MSDVYNLTLAEVGTALLKVLCTRPKVLYALLKIALWCTYVPVDYHLL